MANDFAAPKKKKNKALLFALVGVGLLATTVGGVFAANSITINSGGTIEFGQGLAATGTCDAALTTSITQAYNAGDDKFYAETIVVSGIKDYSCDGKNIHISLIGDNAGTPGVVCSVDGTTLNTDKFLITDDGDDADDDVTKTVVIGASCDATTVTKVAITTS
jgi:hypothetical protein